MGQQVGGGGHGDELMSVVEGGIVTGGGLGQGGQDLIALVGAKQPLGVAHGQGGFTVQEGIQQGLDGGLAAGFGLHPVLGLVRGKEVHQGCGLTPDPGICRSSAGQGGQVGEGPGGLALQVAPRVQLLLRRRQHQGRQGVPTALPRLQPGCEQIQHRHQAQVANLAGLNDQIFFPQHAGRPWHRRGGLPQALGGAAGPEGVLGAGGHPGGQAQQTTARGLRLLQQLLEVAQVIRQHGLVAHIGHVQLGEPTQALEVRTHRLLDALGFRIGQGGAAGSDKGLQVLPGATALGGEGLGLGGGCATTFVGGHVQLDRQRAEKAGLRQQGPQPQHRPQARNAVGHMGQVGLPVDAGHEYLHRLPHPIPHPVRPSNLGSKSRKERRRRRLQLL